MSAATRRHEALQLAEELLGDIELQRVSPLDVARKVGRLARLLDDAEAIEWLRYETGQYPQVLDAEATRAAIRSARTVADADGSVRVWTTGLGELGLRIEEESARLQGLSTAPAAAGDWAYRIELDRAAERNTRMQELTTLKSVLDRVLSSLHEYAASRYQELRFGSAVESAFEVVRAEVDAAIANLVPNALPMLTGAFENAVSNNPEHWANAASTCRRLLKEVADALCPAGPAKRVGNRTVQMGPDNYVNRLVDWIAAHSVSDTATAVVTADLEDFGKRLDAVVDAGHKGAHDTVNRFDASRFITGTYLLLGDVLRLNA